MVHYPTQDTRIQGYLTEDILEDKVCSVRLQLGESSNWQKHFSEQRFASSNGVVVTLSNVEDWSGPVIEG